MISKITSSEILHVNSKKVSCDGGKEMGHPKVYLNIKDKDYIVCPYCSKIFTIKKDIDSDFFSTKQS